MSKSQPEEVYSPQLRSYVDTKKAQPTQPEKRLGPFFVGMTADHALQSIKLSKRRKTKNPEVEMDGDKIASVKWFLTDCVLVLKRVRDPGPYFVVDILPKEADKRAE